jgi:galactose mutarotase-like enzyme
VGRAEARAGKVMDAWVSIRSEHLSAEVDPLGAQLSRLRDSAGRDLLWDGDPSVWNGRAPILFPIVGSLAGGHYRLGTKIYPLSRHGFARGRIFEILDSTSSAAAFRLQADAASRQIYPFDFALDVRFEVIGPALAVTASVRNLGDEAMPASFGFHPALRWPLPYGRARSAHFIEFPLDEPAAIRRLNADGLLSPTPHPTPISQRRLPLEDGLFREDAIIFDQIRSTSATYGADDGPRIRVSYPDTPYLGIWSKPKANFICVEPWHGIADPEGFSGDFKAKPGVFMVPAGAAIPIKMQLALIAS